MDLRAIYQKPRTTVSSSLSDWFPFFLNHDKITIIDQVLATNISYIPLKKVFLYLVAIVDLFFMHIIR